MKFFGKVGYALKKQTTPGVWIDEVVERAYTGNIIYNSRSLRDTEDANPDVTLSERISIIADGFVLNNLHTMRYVEWRGAKWSISSFEVNHPRVILTIGGLYRGKQTRPA